MKAIGAHARMVLEHLMYELELGDVRTFDNGPGVTWSLADFFINTRNLTAATVALVSFEPLLQCLKTKRTLYQLWAACAADAAHSAEAVGPGSAG